MKKTNDLSILSIIMVTLGLTMTSSAFGHHVSKYGFDNETMLFYLTLVLISIFCFVIVVYRYLSK